jgi:hypothetical protein
MGSRSETTLRRREAGMQVSFGARGGARPWDSDLPRGFVGREIDLVFGGSCKSFGPPPTDRSKCTPLSIGFERTLRASIAASRSSQSSSIPCCSSIRIDDELLLLKVVHPQIDIEAASYFHLCCLSSSIPRSTARRRATSIPCSSSSTARPSIL